MKDYPRLLIISPSVFDNRSGAGVTFTNLFKGWPSDKIAMIYSDGIERDESICKRFYRLSDKEIKWVWPFSFIQKLLLRYHAGRKAKGKRVLNEAKTQAKKISLKKALALLFFRFVIGEEMPKRFYMSAELEGWIRDFNPQIVYGAVAKSVFFVDLTIEVAKRFRLPVVTHIMDDWQSIKYKRGVFGPFLRLRLKKRLKELLSMSEARMSICEHMSSAYKKRYGLDFIPFLNTIEASEWEGKIKKDRSSGGVFRILYHGSIYYGSRLASLCSQFNGLMDICEAAYYLNKDGVSSQVTIHTSSSAAAYYRKEFDKFDNVKIDTEFIKTEDIPGFLSGYDLLILPVTFNKKGSYLLRYSMSTKVPEFMMSATPVLLYGPENSAPIQYALKDKWGYVVTEQNIEKLKEAIKKIAQDFKLREDLSQKAVKKAIANHDRQKVSEDFQKIFRDTVFGNGKN